MGECCGRSWVGYVVGWHIHSLHRCHRSFLCRGNSFLERSHFVCQCRLIASSRRHSSKKSGHFRTCLCESENVINKQKHIFSFCIPKIFCHCKSGKSYSKTSSRNFVHLAEHESCLWKYSRFFHFIIKVVSFSSSFSNTSENRISFVDSSHVSNKFLKKDCFSYTSSSEKTNFSSFDERTHKVNDFDTRFKYFYFSRLFCERWWVSMDRPSLSSGDFFFIVNCFSKQVEHSS